MDALLVDAGARVVFLLIKFWSPNDNLTLCFRSLFSTVVTIHCPIAIAGPRHVREVPKHLQIQEEEEQVFEEQFSLFHQKP